MPRDLVFISYSRRDREWLDRLNIHLRPLVRDSGIVTWDDTLLEPGSAWEAEIEKALRLTKVAILMISADFLASDFIAQRELPALLSGAEDDGAVILPLILSPSRFLQTPLAKFQSVNDPARPLIGVGRSEQEEILVQLSEAVDLAMTPSPIKPAPAPSSVGATADAQLPPLVARLAFDKCLARLGARPDQLASEEASLRSWLERRVQEGRWSAEGERPSHLLIDLGEPDEVAYAIEGFFEHLLSCCAPHHHRVGDTYLSVKKVNEAWRLLRNDIQAFRAPDSPADKLVAIHQFLVDNDRLTFLPERLLLGWDLPARDDHVCFFAAPFKLDVDEQELTKIPGAAGLVGKQNKSLYAVVNAVFQNPDPFIYPVLVFRGVFNSKPVSIVLSRKYIEFGSSTATSLARSLGGVEVGILGIGSLRRANAGLELSPLACSFFGEW